MSYCVSCHGTEGKGDGPAAAVMHPKPTGLTSGRLKKGGDLQSIADTIAQGVPGSVMPPFSYLSEEERLALAPYVRLLRQ